MFVYVCVYVSVCVFVRVSVCVCVCACICVYMCVSSTDFLLSARLASRRERGEAYEEGWLCLSYDAADVGLLHPSFPPSPPPSLHPSPPFSLPRAAIAFLMLLEGVASHVG